MNTSKMKKYANISYKVNIFVKKSDRTLNTRKFRNGSPTGNKYLFYELFPR